jgi:hypothetical protein
MLDLRGKKSGNLYALSPTDQRDGSRILWDTVCLKCGRHRLVAAQLFAARYVRSCQDCSNARKGPRKHGKSNGPEWIVWRAMKARCDNPRNISYRRYGAKGVTICDRWRDFENFLADVGPRPPGTKLGRRGNIGNYTPETAYWQTREQQSEEQRKKRGLQANAIRKPPVSVGLGATFARKRTS